MIFCIKRQ